MGAAVTQDVRGAADGKAPIWLVVVASAAGTTFEWYDFFVFGSLASILSDAFFAGLNVSARFVATLATFAIGFAVRPLGALIFGSLGDRIGRKSAFLITIGVMGSATFAIGLMPTYTRVGAIAPILLIGLRLLQGLALGGEYSGAAIYVAEHAPAGRRGELTAWIQTSAAFGLAAALAVILGTRSVLGEDAFHAWGWRIPFLASLGLLLVSLRIRLRLTESPIYLALKERGETSTRPLREAFSQWRNLRVVLLVLFGVVIAQGAVWYLAHFYVQFFLERVLKVAPATVNALVCGVVLAGAPLYVFFGWLSDRVGRKPVMLFGMALAIVAPFPGFAVLTQAANPALAAAITRSPITVKANPAQCSLQFDPVGASQFRSSCDLAKSALAGAGVPYTNLAAPAGATAVVRIGDATISSREAAGLPDAAAQRALADVTARIGAALKAAGYPPAADPARINYGAVIGVLLLLIVAATALYGPQAAALVELFPARIRYTATGLPYNIGVGWVGGFLPAVAFAMVIATGNIYFGLWYPIAFTATAFVVALLFLPETCHRSIGDEA